MASSSRGAEPPQDALNKETVKSELYEYLVGNLDRAISELYTLCEYDSNDVRTAAAVEMLAEGQDSFKDLLERLMVILGKAPAAGAPSSSSAGLSNAASSSTVVGSGGGRSGTGVGSGARTHGPVAKASRSGLAWEVRQRTGTRVSTPNKSGSHALIRRMLERMSEEREKMPLTPDLGGPPLPLPHTSSSSTSLTALVEGAGADSSSLNTSGGFDTPNTDGSGSGTGAGGAGEEGMAPPNVTRSRTGDARNSGKFREEEEDIEGSNRSDSPEPPAVFSRGNGIAISSPATSHHHHHHGSSSSTTRTPNRSSSSSAAASAAAAGGDNDYHHSPSGAGGAASRMQSGRVSPSRAASSGVTGGGVGGGGAGGMGAGGGASAPHRTHSHTAVVDDRPAPVLLLLSHLEQGGLAWGDWMLNEDRQVQMRLQQQQQMQQQPQAKGGDDGYYGTRGGTYTSSPGAAAGLGNRTPVRASSAAAAAAQAMAAAAGGPTAAGSRDHDSGSRSEGSAGGYGFTAASSAEGDAYYDSSSSAGAAARGQMTWAAMAGGRQDAQAQAESAGLALRNLHEKLSSPERQRPSPQETARRAEQRQAAAEAKRLTMQEEKRTRLQEQTARARDANQRVQQRQAEVATTVHEKLEAAGARHSEVLRVRKMRAESQLAKVAEATRTGADGLVQKKEAMQRQMEEASKRREESLQKRTAKVGERSARVHESVQQRKQQDEDSLSRAADDMARKQAESEARRHALTRKRDVGFSYASALSGAARGADAGPDGGAAHNSTERTFGVDADATAAAGMVDEEEDVQVEEEQETSAPTATDGPAAAGAAAPSSSVVPKPAKVVVPAAPPTNPWRKPAASVAPPPAPSSRETGKKEEKVEQARVAAPPAPSSSSSSAAAPAASSSSSAAVAAGQAPRTKNTAARAPRQRAAASASSAASSSTAPPQRKAVEADDGEWETTGKKRNTATTVKSKEPRQLRTRKDGASSSAASGPPAAEAGSTKKQESARVAVEKKEVSTPVAAPAALVTSQAVAEISLNSTPRASTGLAWGRATAKGSENEEAPGQTSPKPVPAVVAVAVAAPALVVVAAEAVTAASADSTPAPPPAAAAVRSKTKSKTAAAAAAAAEEEESLALLAATVTAAAGAAAAASSSTSSSAGAKASAARRKKMRKARVALVSAGTAFGLVAGPHVAESSIAPSASSLGITPLARAVMALRRTVVPDEAAATTSSISASASEAAAAAAGDDSAPVGGLSALSSLPGDAEAAVRDVWRAFEGKAATAGSTVANMRDPILVGMVLAHTTTSSTSLEGLFRTSDLPAPPTTFSLGAGGGSLLLPFSATDAEILRKGQGLQSISRVISRDLLSTHPRAVAQACRTLALSCTVKECRDVALAKSLAAPVVDVASTILSDLGARLTARHPHPVPSTSPHKGGKGGAADGAWELSTAPVPASCAIPFRLEAGTDVTDAHVCALLSCLEVLWALLRHEVYSASSSAAASSVSSAALAGAEVSIISYLLASGMIQFMGDVFRAVRELPAHAQGAYTPLLQASLAFFVTVARRPMVDGGSVAWEKPVYVSSSPANGAAPYHDALVAALCDAGSCLIDVPSLIISLVTASIDHAEARPSSSASSVAAAAGGGGGGGGGAAAPLAHPHPPARLEPVVLTTSTLALQAVNAAARLDLRSVQRVLANPSSSSSSLSLVRHSLDTLLSHIAPTLKGQASAAATMACDAMVHELLLFVGYLALDNTNVQESLRWGVAPTCLQRLCNLPFRYFAEEGHKRILLPTLIAASFGNEGNKAVLQSELALDSFLTFLLEAEAARAHAASSNSSATAIPPHLRLEARFPPEKWARAIDFLKKPAVHAVLVAAGE